MPAESFNRQRFQMLLKEINIVVDNEDDPYFLAKMKEMLTKKLDEKLKKPIR